MKIFGREKPIEVFVDCIRVNQEKQHYVVFLKERTGKRTLPIWIGEFEAQGIAMVLQQSINPRPLPWDIYISTVAALGGAIESVGVTSLTDNVFISEVVLLANGKRHRIDARPSDVIAIAVRAKAPILVDPEVMERAGVVDLETEDDSEAPAEQK